MTVEELARFIWAAEYDDDAYPWPDLNPDEQAYYLHCAEALLDKFEIRPKN